MKLTTLFLVAVALHVGATGFGQKITISGKDLPLEKVFTMVRKQAGYVFFYSYDILQRSKNVNLNLKEVEVVEVMQAALWGQGLDFSITGKTITIIRNDTTSEPLQSVRKTIKVSGVVYSDGGQPLSGANITIKETGKGTITNAKGEFLLPAVPESSPLMVSFIGYASQVVKTSEGRPLQIYLTLAKNELDKVVIQAYGITSARLTTSDIGRISKEEIEKQPVMNPIMALQGRVAGLEVTQTSGYASAPLKVEIRGRNFIGNQFTSDPLYIIDGVPLTVLEVGGNSQYLSGSFGFIQSGIGGPANGQSPFFNINPLDIESMEVLKDADATAIYGSRGANGVILITTKKGKTGKTKLDLHLTQGINKVTRYWDMMNLQQYLSMRREAYKNDGITPTVANGAYDLYSWDTTKSTDWQKTIYGGTGKNTDVLLSLSGGDTRTTFRIGAGYTKTTSILTASGADQRASLSLNLGHQSADRRFGIAISSGYSFTQTDMIGLPSNAAMLPPNAPPIYDSAGNPNYNGWGDAYTNGRYAYPFASLFSPYSSKTNMLTSSLTLNYQPVKGVHVSTNFGYNNAMAIQQSFYTIASQDPLSDPTGTAQFGNNRNSNWIIEPQISYNAVLGNGILEVMAGGSVQHVSTSGLQLYGYGYNSDDLIKTIANAPNTITVDNYGEYRYAAAFTRINYNWKNKYIVNLNARRDGSSRFGAGRQFGNFGSVGAAWIFGEENWIQNHFKFLSFGKLRASYGSTGSDAVGDYGYISRWTSINTVPYQGYRPLYPTQHANPAFQWQVVKKLEGALDLGFLKDNIRLSVAYYRDRCGNQLVSFPTPMLSGFGSVIGNSPALVQNNGVEITTSFKLVNDKKFNWSVNFNMAINHNKLVAYPNITQSPYAHSLIIGKSLNIMNLYHYIGVNPQTGYYSFDDRNHDGQFSIYPNSVTDDSYAYDLSPKFTGGLGTSFSYKNWNLYLFFNIRKARGLNAYFATGGIFGSPVNGPVEIIGKEWKNAGDITSIARFTTLPNTSLSANSELGYTDASFVRLSTVSLSYNLSETFLKKAGMQNGNVFIHTNNLFTITKYMGVDPETQNFGSMPPNRVISGGISLDF